MSKDMTEINKKLAKLQPLPFDSYRNEVLDEAKMIVKQKLTTFEEKQGAFADKAVVECCRDIAEEAIEKLKEKG